MTKKEKIKEVLIIEDDLKVQTVLANKVERRGYKARVASNGKKGLAKIKRKAPDLILLDIMMPVMDGIEMLSKMREINKAIPVLILTNLSDKERYRDLLKRDTCQYFVKAEHSIDDIAREIERMLRKSDQNNK